MSHIICFNHIPVGSYLAIKLKETKLIFPNIKQRPTSRQVLEMHNYIKQTQLLKGTISTWVKMLTSVPHFS
jgi:hypothetical protein